jgi:hypothetical protein
VPVGLVVQVMHFQAGTGAPEGAHRLDAPLKGFYTFERSAHCPVLEEAEKAQKILRQDVLAGLTVLAGAVSLGFRECWPCVQPVPA